MRQQRAQEAVEDLRKATRRFMREVRSICGRAIAAGLVMSALDLSMELPVAFARSARNLSSEQLA